jgi:phage baseplate assembly protein W
MTDYRALRFTGLGLADASGGTGLTVGPTGALTMIDGDDSVRQAIIMLLTTAPGERLMRPAYGSYLNRLAFAPNDQTTAGLAIHYVRSALARWEPRVEVVEVDAGADPDRPELLVITLHYRVRASLSVEHLELTIAIGDAS